MTDEDDVALPAMVVAEDLTGVLLDDDQGRRAAQHPFLDDVLAVAPVVDYTPAVAEHHAALLAHVTRTPGRSPFPWLRGQRPTAGPHHQG